MQTPLLSACHSCVERLGDPAVRAERKPTAPRHAAMVPANYRLKLAVLGRSEAEALRRTRAAA